MPANPKHEDEVEVATLSRRALNEISQITQDVRLTQKRLTELDCAPLAVMDADAVDAIKDLFYVVSNEDPLNVMPARKLLCEQHVVATCLLPLLAAVNGDESASENQKRWSVCLYHTFRVLSQLCVPVSPTNELLRPGCAMDTLLLDIRVKLVRAPAALEAIVALLQYYVERKAEKQARFAPAEESKIEDARIENILVFFCNILAPPRFIPHQEQEVRARDLPIHLALVSALHDADLYATLAILFSSREEGCGQMTRLVFTVADIYRHTYRYSTPKEIALYSTNVKAEPLPKPEPSSENPPVDGNEQESAEQKEKSVFNFLNDEVEKSAANQSSKNAAKLKSAIEKRNRRGAGLREAMQRERSLLGGSRAVTTSARWANRFSGGFTTVAREAASDGADKSANPDGTVKNSDPNDTKEQPAANPFAKRVIAARSAVDKSKDVGPAAVVRKGVKLNSELLCAATASQVRKTVLTNKSSHFREIRTELQSKGRRAISELTIEFIEVSFVFFTRELRHRIEEAKSRNDGAGREELPYARRAFLAIVAAVVGFQRERIAVDPKRSKRERLRMHVGDMDAFIKEETCVVGNRWVSVEAGIELDSFKLAFDALLEFSGAGRSGAEDEMLATFAIRQMMQMVQSLVLHPEKEEDIEKEWESMPENSRPKRPRLTGRETALNILEELFEREEYLNAPCRLAKEYDPKLHTFAHLANVVEVAHAFTSTLLDEKELGEIKVMKTRRKKKKKKPVEEDDEEELLKNELEKKEQDDNQEKPSADSTDGPNLETKNSDGDDQENSSLAKESNAGEADKNVVSEEGNAAAAETAETREVSATAGTENQAVTSEEKADSKNGEEKNADKVGEEVTKIDEEELSESEPEIYERKVESSGVIRRFAHSRALQVLAIPIRACFCTASSISGALFTIPDGSRDILSAELAAKSVAVLTSIWNTSGRRDKGSLRGHYFTFSLLQLLSLAMNAGELKKVPEYSIIGRLADFGKRVTRVLHTWLTINPGLALDLFLGMDKGTCLQYAHSIHLKDTVLSKDDDDSQDDGGYGTSDAEDVLDEIERRAQMAAIDGDLSDVERVKPKAPKKPKTIKKQKNRRKRTSDAHVEDDDVDDIDALDIGLVRDEEDDDDTKGSSKQAEMVDAALENDTTPRAYRRKKRKAVTVAGDGIDFGSSSDSDDSEDRTPTRRRRKKQKSSGKPGDGSGKKKSKPRKSPGTKKRGSRRSRLLNLVDGEVLPAIDPMSDDDLDDDELERYNKFLEKEQVELPKPNDNAAEGNSAAVDAEDEMDSYVESDKAQPSEGVSKGSPIAVETDPRLDDIEDSDDGPLERPSNTSIDKVQTSGEARLARKIELSSDEDRDEVNSLIY